MIVLKCPVCGNPVDEAIDGGCCVRCDNIFHGKEEIEEIYYPENIYIILSENRIGTEIMIQRWGTKPFIGGKEYIIKANKHWRPISEHDRNECKGIHLYGLIIRHAVTGHEHFECYPLYIDEEGELRDQCGDYFSDWSYSDFTHWIPLPPAPESENENV